MGGVPRFAGSSLGLKSVGGAKVCGVKPWTEICGGCQGAGSSHV